jgi:hypothetical protein
MLLRYLAAEDHCLVIHNNSSSNRRQDTHSNQEDTTPARAKEGTRLNQVSSSNHRHKVGILQDTVLRSRARTFPTRTSKDPEEDSRLQSRANGAALADHNNLLVTRLVHKTPEVR